MMPIPLLLPERIRPPKLTESQKLREFFTDVGVLESAVCDAGFPALTELGAERFLEREPDSTPLIVDPLGGVA